MQYTAKPPHNSVLILQPEGLRYRFQEDHVFKDIRYSQITGVKVKKNLFIHYINFFIPPFVFITQSYSIFTDGLNWSNGLNATLWLLIFCQNALTKKVYTVSVLKGPLTAEVYGTHDAKEAKAIKRVIESHR